MAPAAPAAAPAEAEAEPEAAPPAACDAAYVNNNESEYMYGVVFENQTPMVLSTCMV